MESSTASTSTSPTEKTPVADVADKPAQLVEDEYEDAEKNYRPKTLKFWTIMISVYLSMFLVGLDRTIIATAIPRITDEFHSIEDIGCKCNRRDLFPTSIPLAKPSGNFIVF
jgi:hypothetical protein